MAKIALRRWAFTRWIQEDEEWETVKNNLIETLGNTRRWVFQLEKGETCGKLHFQGRVSFKIAKRERECELAMPKCNFRIEVTENEEASTFYCMKSATKIEGPWSDKDQKKGEVPWDLAKITEWKPWQQSIIDSLTERDDRIINVLIDEEGGIGKSKVFKHCLWNKLAGLIPVIGDAKDIIQAVCSMGARDAYIVDFPRTGESDQHQQSIYKAIEQVKNGVVLDLRYKYTELIMGSPVIWIFTNQMPDCKFLSMDRWRYWVVRDDELKQTRRIPAPAPLPPP